MYITSAYTHVYIPASPATSNTFGDLRMLLMILEVLWSNTTCRNQSVLSSTPNIFMLMTTLLWLLSDWAWSSSASSFTATETTLSKLLHYACAKHHPCCWKMRQRWLPMPSGPSHLKHKSSQKPNLTPTRQARNLHWLLQPWWPFPSTRAVARSCCSAVWRKTAAASKPAMPCLIKVYLLPNNRQKPTVRFS